MGVVRRRSLAPRTQKHGAFSKIYQWSSKSCIKALRNAPYEVGDRTTGENRTASLNPGLGYEGAHQPVGQTTPVGGTDALYFLGGKVLLVKAENIAVDSVGIKGRLLGQI